MPRVKKSDGFSCPLCGCEMEVVVSAYGSEPFIDGRYYEQICFTCHNVPQTYHFDEKSNELVIYPWRPDKLYTWEQMCSEVGYDKKDKEEKKRVNKSIRSVKSAINSMNEDKRAALIKASKAGEIRTLVDPDDDLPEPEVDKEPPVKAAPKKKAAKKKPSLKKSPPRKRTSKKT